jgi:hypothetical protein
MPRGSGGKEEEFISQEQGAWVRVKTRVVKLA